MQLKKKILSLFLPLFSIFFTLFVFRSIFDNRLLGDPFDSRLQIILHEHWWRWFNGLVDFRNTEFFYPFDKALGYSDVFLVQGIIYSFFRFVGLNLANSWSITTILLLVIGNLGWFYISKIFFTSKSIQFLAIPIFISSLSFVYYFTYNPNIVGYSFLSWFFLFTKNILSDVNEKTKHWKISLYIVFLLIYALSCWYGAFFVILILFVRLIISLISKETNLRFLIKSFMQNIKPYLFLFPIKVFFIWLFAYVYIAVANQPSRPLIELFTNSPRVNLLANGSNIDGTKLNGAIFEYFYSNSFLSFEKEYGIGVGLASLILVVFSIVIGMKLNIYSLSFKKWIITIVAVYVYFIVWFERFSIHQFFFEYIPGFNSIRNPSRYVIILGFSFLFLILYTSDKLLTKFKSKRSRLIVFFCLITLLLDQQRNSFKGWDPKILVNTDLMSQREEIISKCDYFYYDVPGGWWYDQIEAMTFAIQIGVPTVNGYSGAFPPGYPNEPFNSNAEPYAIFDWIKTINNGTEKGCFVTGKSTPKVLTSEFEHVDFVGFTEIEKSDLDQWRWAVSPNPYIYILGNNLGNVNLKFEIRTTSCYPLQTITLADGQDVPIGEDLLIDTSEELSVNFDMSDAFVRRLQIITNAGPCRTGNDERDLFFEIKNFQLIN
jgi:hypothetical protein